MNFVQANKLLIGAAFILLTSVGNAMDNVTDIQMLQTVQSLNQLLALPKTMTMSNEPKKLSAAPQAICFKANINEFLIGDNATYKPIYGCVFSDQVAMNAALLRAGLYVHTSMGMADDEKLFTSNLMTAVAGHDFNGAELSDYNQHAIIPDTTATEHKRLKEIEKEFDAQIIKPLIQQNKENFIFFAIINTKKYKENLSHELLHAQYYNLPQIKPVLLTTWQQVSPADQQIIIKSLRDGGYDMDQQELLLREFYSYFLQYNAQKYLASIKVLAPMADLADKYAPVIQQALEKHGLKVLVAD
jgi:hypothetical protein